jgi:hypothetical protein
LCDICGQQITTNSAASHVSSHDTPTTNSSHVSSDAEPSYPCDICFAIFESEVDLNSHILDIHCVDYSQVGGGGNAGPQYPWLLENGDTDDELKHIYKKYAKLIYRPSEKGTLRDEYNFAFDSKDIDIYEIAEHLESIFLDQNNAFKINLSLGFVLRDSDVNLRYFYPHDNENMSMCVQI